MLRRAVSLVNARVVAGGEILPSIRFASEILSLGGAPKRRDLVVDLDGAFVLPGLVNAHDHLELNHFGRIKFRGRHENASVWIDDMRPRLRGDARIREALAHSLSDRLRIGLLKNLLSGVTTVCHHNPFYRELRWRLPIRVVRRYGWAHSLDLQNQKVGARGELGSDVRRAFARTPEGAPFLIHLAEGVDVRAREELSRLEALGCVSDRTVLVHGVGISTHEWRRARGQGVGLVWCPASNLFLFGCTAPVRSFLEDGGDSICLGTDSRLTGSRDLLDEMRAAEAASSLPPELLLRMVTTTAARLLRLPRAGRIATGLPADLVVVPPLAADPARALLAASRERLLLVTVGGRPVAASPELAEIFTARRVKPVPATLDGAPKWLDSHPARRLRDSPLLEPGLELG